MNGIVIKRLSPNLLDDFLYFFDDIAFRDNPEWSHCYCRFPQAPHDDCKWQDFDVVAWVAVVIVNPLDRTAAEILLRHRPMIPPHQRTLTTIFLFRSLPSRSGQNHTYTASPAPRASR